MSPSQKAGIAFEKSVMRALSRSFPDLRSALRDPPWISYVTGGAKKYALPDGVVPSCGLLIECKLTRVLGTSVEEKLASLYEPICDLIWPQAAGWRKIIIMKYWKGPQVPLLARVEDAPLGVSYMIWRP